MQPKSDDPVTQEAEKQLRLQAAIKSAYTQLLPDWAAKLSWKDVFESEDVDLDDIDSLLSVLHQDWRYVDLDHGGSNPFYEVLEYTDTQQSVGLKNANQLALFSQFAIARVNIFAQANELANTNFGEILDHPENAELRGAFAEALARVMSAQEDVEAAVIGFVNHNQIAFGLNRALSPEETAGCAAQIKKQLTLLKDFKHMDEFFFLEDVQDPLFVEYRNLLSFPFAKLSALSEDDLSEQHQRQLDSFAALRKEGAMLNGDCLLTLEKILDSYPDEKLSLVEKLIRDNIASDAFMDHLQRLIYAESMLSVTAKVCTDVVAIVKNVDSGCYAEFMDSLLSKCGDDASKRTCLQFFDCANRELYVEKHPDLKKLFATSLPRRSRLEGLLADELDAVAGGGASHEQKQEYEQKPSVKKTSAKKP